MSGEYNHKNKLIDSTLSCICLRCGKESKFSAVKSGCPHCFHHIFKAARRGTGYPGAFTWDQKKDPYRTEVVPGDGQGFDPALTTPGTEETSGGFGTRFRGKDSPTGFSEKSDNYEEQRKKDIPGSDHMFVDEEDAMPLNHGVDDGTFFDSDSPLSFENSIAEKLYSPPDPVGPHNQHNYGNRNRNRDVFDRVRQQQEGN